MGGSSNEESPTAFDAMTKSKFSLAIDKEYATGSLPVA